MRNRRHHGRHSIEQLRLAIDCMPVATREAMLVGVRSNERIIAGAYVDDRGGVCPMLAAHRCGGRTDFLSFAKSWDRFTRATKARAVTVREVAILIGQLEDSVMSASGLELDRAISEHRELRSRRMRSRGQLARAWEPAGEIVVRRLRRAQSGADLGRQSRQRDRSPAAVAGLIARLTEPTQPRARPQTASPGRTNIISGTTQAGETFSR